MAPSRYMGLPWPEWGETDVALTGALHHMDASMCGCGCGYPIDVSHDQATADRWQVEVSTCFAGQALGLWRDKHRGDLEPGQMAFVRLMDEGEEPVDPLAFDPSRAAQEYAEHMASLGLDG